MKKSLNYICMVFKKTLCTFYMTFYSAEYQTTSKRKIITMVSLLAAALTLACATDYAIKGIILNKDRLTHISWLFMRVDGTVIADNVTLSSDGFINGYNHPNERFWRIKNGNLEILNEFGAESTVFSRINASLFGGVVLRDVTLNQTHLFRVKNSFSLISILAFSKLILILVSCIIIIYIFINIYKSLYSKTKKKFIKNLEIISNSNSIKKPSLDLILLVVLAVFLCVLAWGIWAPSRLTLGDGIAQFFPTTYSSYKSIKIFQIPLINYYNFLGYPAIGAAYYPILYPLTWISFFFAEITGDIQQAWNYLGFLQIILNSIFVFLLAKIFFEIDAVFSIIAGLSAGFLGIVVHFVGDWFYVAPVIGFTALLMLLGKKLIDKPSLIYVVGFALSGAMFLFASNIQFVFYSAHFVGFALIIYLFSNISKFSDFLKYKASIFALALALFLTLVLLIPYLIDMVKYMGESMRETNRVSIDKFFWEAISFWSTLKYIFYPTRGDAPLFWQTPFISYCGLVPSLGVLLIPFAFALVKVNNKRKELFMLLYLFVSCLLAFLLSAGHEGRIGYLLYQIPPYNWFRHSIKWAPFFQLFFVLAGIYSLSLLFKMKMFLKFPRLIFASKIILLATTLGLLIVFLYISNNPKRLTNSSIPLQQPTVALDYKYRHLPVWHKHPEIYSTDKHSKILSHNFNAYWGLVSIAGYEPMITKRNCEKVYGNWHPGFYTEVESFDLKKFIQYATRYIRTPGGLGYELISKINEKYPDVVVKYLAYDNSLDVDVLEIEDVEPLVHIANADNGSVLDFKIHGNEIHVDVNIKSKNAEIVFAWLYSQKYTARIDGQHVTVSNDEYDRILVRPKREGQYKIVLIYGEAQARFYVFWYLSFAILLFVVFLILRNWRATPSLR